MDAPFLSDAERLALETDWLRRLARRLIGDVHAAEDAVQDALVAALDRPHWARKGDGALRAWLHGTVQNIARMGRRGAARRAERERVWGEGRPTAEPSPDEIVERARGARQLMDAVLELDEPYRTAVLLAYGEGLDAPTIAERVGATPVAVRKRISRGIQRLRTQLADETGAAPPWLLGVAGLAAPSLEGAAALPAAGAVATAATAALTMKWITAAALAVLIGVSLWGFLKETAPTLGTDVARGPERAAEAATPDLSSALDAGREGGAERAAVASTTESEAEASAGEGAAIRFVRGRVLLDREDRGLAGAGLYLATSSEGVVPGVASEEALARSGRDGSFTMSLPRAALEAAAEHGLWMRHEGAHDVHVSASRIAALGDGELIITTVPLGRLVVTVLDEEGEPDADRRIVYSLKPRHGSDAQLWSFQGPRAGGTSDRAGRVVIDGLPASTEIRVGLRGEYEMPASAVIDPVTLAAAVTLKPTPWGEVRATLRWPDGAPAAGVPVTWYGAPHRSGGFDGYERESDEEGVVLFDGLGRGDGRLVFDAGGFHAPVETRSERGTTRDLGVLTLERAVELSGRVELGALVGIEERLHVIAFRGGSPVASQVLTGSSEFTLEVPAGPTTLAVARGLDWNPILPFRDAFLGQAVAVAPASDVVLRCAGPGASATGQVSSGETSVTALHFVSDPGLSFGIPWPDANRTTKVPVDGEGRFVVPIEPGPPSRLLIQGADGRRAYRALDGLGEGEVQDLGELDWREARVLVRVLDGQSRPVGGVKVSMRNTDGDTADSTSDERGVATFELPVGPYGVEVDAGELGSRDWTLVHVTEEETVDVTLQLAERALLTGRIRRDSGPAADVTVKVQRMEPVSNLILAATSGADGAFTFKPLPPGLYRYRVQGEVVGTVTLEAGRTAELDIAVEGAATTVEIRADGERLTAAGGLHVRSAAEPNAPWAKGRAITGGAFEAALPEGELVFAINVDSLGNNQQIVVQGPAATGATYTLELPDTGIEIRLDGAAAQSPVPTVYLESLDGRSAATHWGPRPELHVEDEGIGADGVRTVRVPYVDAGARVLIKGIDADGKRTELTVDVGAAGPTIVPWR